MKVTSGFLYTGREWEHVPIHMFLFDQASLYEYFLPLSKDINYKVRGYHVRRMKYFVAMVWLVRCKLMRSDSKKVAFSYTCKQPPSNSQTSQCCSDLNLSSNHLPISPTTKCCNDWNLLQNQIYLLATCYVHFLT